MQPNLILNLLAGVGFAGVLKATRRWIPGGEGSGAPLAVAWLLVSAQIANNLNERDESQNTFVQEFGILGLGLFDHFLSRSSLPPTHNVWSDLLGGYACRMLHGACIPMLCPGSRLQARSCSRGCRKMLSCSRSATCPATPRGTYPHLPRSTMPTLRRSPCAAIDAVVLSVPSRCDQLSDADPRGLRGCARTRARSLSLYLSLPLFTSVSVSTYQVCPDLRARAARHPAHRPRDDDL